MDIIVSDTTALIILGKCRRFDLLSNLFKRVYIPKAVQEEIGKKNDTAKKEIFYQNFIVLKEIQQGNIYHKIQSKNLDMGEIEAITLSLELNLRLLIDEKRGRKVAKDEGIKVVGLLGILKENFIQNYISIEEVKTIFNQFKDNEYRISEKIEKLFFDDLNRNK